VWGLRWQTYLHFARHLAAESAGGSVSRHVILSRSVSEQARLKIK
jgi:hypothetical protein